MKKNLLSWVIILVVSMLMLGVLFYMSKYRGAKKMDINGKIAFQSDRGQQEFGIYLLENRASTYLCEGRMPYFSDNGENLVFVNTARVDTISGASDNLFEINVRTKEIKELNTLDLRLSRYASPVFSPGGDMIAFIAKEGKFDNIFLMNSKNREIIKLTDYKKNGEKPIDNMLSGLVWDKKREKIIYNDWGKGVFAVGVRSKKIEMLINGTSRSIGKCSISPDSQFIVFSGNGIVTKDGFEFKYSEIFLMNFDDKKIKRLTNNRWEDKDPCWSPDGKQICFSSYRHGGSIVGGELFVLDIANGAEYQITKAVRRGNRKGPFSGWSTDIYSTWTK